MPWRCAALEDLDDDHATAAAWTRAREGGRLVAIMMIGIGSLALGFLATSSWRARAMLSAQAAWRTGRSGGCGGSPWAGRG